jgi:hypothetical protein
MVETSPLRVLPSLLAASLVWAACTGEVDTSGDSTGTGAAAGSGGTAGTGGTAAGGAAAGSGGVGGVGAMGGTGGSGGVSCNPTGVVCATAPPNCDPGEVPSIDGPCWGPCVPILDCATEASCANCQGAFCAEYVAWVTEYRCVLPSLQCSATTCSCLAPYFCPAPFDACQEGSIDGPIVSCGCPAC